MYDHWSPESSEGKLMEEAVAKLENGEHTGKGESGFDLGDG